MGAKHLKSGEKVEITTGAFRGKRGKLEVVASSSGKKFNVILDEENKKICGINRNSFTRLESAGKRSRTSKIIHDDDDEDEDDENKGEEDVDDDDDDDDNDKVDEVDFPELEEYEEVSNEVEWREQHQILGNLEGSLPNHLPTFLVPHGEHPIDYFNMFFYNEETLSRWVEYTNRNIEADASQHGGPINIGDIRRFVGLRIQMVVLSFRNTHDYWKTECPDELHAPTKFGESRGISLHRFETISRNLAFAGSTTIDQNDDPWRSVRPLVDDFNQRRQDVFSPGKYLTVDESVSMWTSSKSHSDPTACPHITYIPDKPVSEGIVVKNTSCGETGIMLKIEIQEGQERMRKKKYQFRKSGSSLDAEYLRLLEEQDVHKCHVALVLRLTEEYFGSQRVVIMDSHFASYACSVALLNHGLHSIGMVKTNSQHYCMDYFKQWQENVNRESENIKKKVTTTTSAGHETLYSTNASSIRVTDVELTDGSSKKFAAVASIRYNGKMSTLISTVGNTQHTSSRYTKRKRYIPNENEELVEHAVECEEVLPQIISQYYKYSHLIDDHNNLRQGSLGIERKWKTMKWQMRFFATLVGMILVDAYRAYQFQNKLKLNLLTFDEFTQNISLQLCPKVDVAAHSSASNEVLNQKDFIKEINNHPLVSLKTISDPNLNDFRKYCHICHTRTSFACLTCSRPPSGEIRCVAVHGPAEKTECYAKHIANHLNV